MTDDYHTEGEDHPPLAEEVLGRMTIEQDDEPNMELIARCIENSSAARGIDYYAVEVRGYSPEEWADLTDRNRRTVRRNVNRAKGEE